MFHAVRAWLEDLFAPRLYVTVNIVCDGEIEPTRLARDIRDAVAEAHRIPRGPAS